MKNKLLPLLTTLFCLASLISYSQQQNNKNENNETSNQIKYEEREFEGGDYLRNREEWFKKINAGRETENVNYSAKYFDAFKKMQKKYPILHSLNKSKTMDLAWHSIGPDSYENTCGWNSGMGRVNCIAFHPTEAQIIYAGTPAGGLWQTLDHGQSWKCLTDNVVQVGVSGISIDFINPYIIYALTGDGEQTDDTKSSLGVIKSIDGGLTWEVTGLQFDANATVFGHKLIMNPKNSRVLFVATSAGIWKTSNGGISWNTVLANEEIFDIETKPGNPKIIYAVSSNKFFLSTDGGENWTQSVYSPFSFNSDRMAIAVTPAKPSQVAVLSSMYYGSSNTKRGLLGVYVSYNNGDTFLLRSSSPNILGYDSLGLDSASQSVYDLTLAVDRLDFKTIYAGGINIWKSITKGSTWIAKTFWNESANASYPYIHPDQHALEINPLNNYLYAASDGGIFYSTDGGNTWTNISNGLSISQIYRISKFSVVNGGFFFWFAG